MQTRKLLPHSKKLPRKIFRTWKQPCSPRPRFQQTTIFDFLQKLSIVVWHCLEVKDFRFFHVCKGLIDKFLAPDLFLQEKNWKKCGRNPAEFKNCLPQGDSQIPCKTIGGPAGTVFRDSPWCVATEANVVLLQFLIYFLSKTYLISLRVETLIGLHSGY